MTSPTRLPPPAARPAPDRVRHLTPRPAGRAFTLIELLVVIVIIGILSTLLLVGINGLRNTAKRQQTHAALQQCLSIYAAWDAVAPRPVGAPRFAPSAMPCPQNMTVDLNPVPSMGPAQADDTTAANRYGAAVWFTRDLMFNVRSVPSNAAALAKVSPGSLMTMPAVYNTTFPKAYAPPQYPPNGAEYQPFDATQYGRVYYTDTFGNQTYYDCLQDNKVGGSTYVPPGNLQYWMQAYPVYNPTGSRVADDAVPVLLDGWGNPIIFVPGGILGNGAAINADGTVIPGSGSMHSSAVSAPAGYQVRSPDGRPFFASAGPDGDFSKADDNLYSFEK